MSIEMLTPQNAYITLAFTPVDINSGGASPGRTGIRVDMRDFAYATFIGTTQDSAAAVTYTFQRHTAVSSGTTEVWDVLDTSTDLSGSTVWTKQATTDAAVLTADAFTRVAATTSSTFATTAGSGCVVVVKFDAEDLALNASTVAIGATMRWISVDVSAPGNACICAGFWILTGSRYSQEPITVTLP